MIRIRTMIIPCDRSERVSGIWSARSTEDMPEIKAPKKSEAKITPNGCTFPKRETTTAV
jgi:hypothetical protein